MYPEHGNRFPEEELYLVVWNNNTQYLKARSSFINNTYCNQFYATDGIKVDEKTKMCYGNPDYFLVPGICRIAPGAPLVRDLHFNSYIFGLPTYAYDCGFGYPAIVTRVSYYIDWMDSVIFSEKAKKEITEMCFLPSGEKSSCKRASDCPHLVQDVKSGKGKLVDYICQFDDTLNPLVCCPKLNISHKYDFESK